MKGGTGGGTAGGCIWAAVRFLWDSWEAFTQKGHEQRPEAVSREPRRSGVGRTFRPRQSRCRCAQGRQEGPGMQWRECGWARRTARVWGQATVKILP